MRGGEHPGNGVELKMQDLNRPFPSCAKPLFQSEAKCETIDIEMFFYSHVNEAHFHKKGFARNVPLKVRVFGCRKWPPEK